MSSNNETNYETDIIIELLEIYMNMILFGRELYPPAVFRERKAYNVPIRVSIFKPLNDYMEKTLLIARELKRQKKLSKVELLVYKDDADDYLESYVFELDHRDFALETDEHLIELEAQVRKSLLNLNGQLKALNKLPSNATFKVLLHTIEAAFARIENNPKLQKHPFVQQIERPQASKCSIQLLPVSHTATVGIQFYVEQYVH
ncbi:DNA polymerase zeta subunit 2 [Sabethes cyaneus]|uniref:DNA polymerase zeta subunit 2 n=1 Tax=Sabethes cyaneus TaxID=53552 RepID=UPI00237E4D2F|nr:DNA polymerase zeta subunit 2 [Sabethes cyaneus]